MFSNERPSQSFRQPFRQQGYPSYTQQPRQPVQESTLKSGQIQIERKTFVLTLKENSQGRFLRISEENHMKRNAIIVPATGLFEFRQMIEDMMKASVEIPAKNQVGGA